MMITMMTIMIFPEGKGNRFALFFGEKFFLLCHKRILKTERATNECLCLNIRLNLELEFQLTVLLYLCVCVRCMDDDVSTAALPSLPLHPLS